MNKSMTYTFIFLAVVLIGYLYSLKYGNKAKKDISEHFQKEKQTEQNPYNEMRKMAFSVTTKDLGIEIPNDSIKVYGIITDLAMDDGVATVVTFLTGDASIYLSSGGGFIGAGQHESVKKVTTEFVNDSHLISFKGKPFENPNLPEDGYASFYFLSNMSQTKISEKISKMENGESEFSELFFSLNKVISEIRIKSGR
jgi:hypothetical protein